MSQYDYLKGDFVGFTQVAEELEDLKTQADATDVIVDALDPTGLLGARTAYTITPNPSNYSSGASKLSFYQRIGDWCNIQISMSYTSTGTPIEVTWDCLPFNAVGNNFITFSCNHNGNYGGFRWQPIMALGSAGSTILTFRRYDGTQTFVASSGWLVITGGYFIN
jgi:hypothetical protein